MFLIYRPADGDEQRWTFKPAKVSVFEAEAVEMRTGWTYDEFVINAKKGSAKARRVLLWMLQRRQHPTLRLEDVHFEMGELELEFDAMELQDMRDTVAASGMDEETKALALAQMDAQIATAEPDPDGPKAPSAS